MRKYKTKYLNFVADFETTFHKEFSNLDLLIDNKNTSNVIIPDQVDISPDTKSEVFLAGLLMINGPSKFKISYENLADFFENIVKCMMSQEKYKAKVYFHNLKYDGSYILSWLLKRGYTQTLKTSKYNKPILRYKEFALFESSGKWFKLTVKWRKFEINFIDSLKMFPQNLASLGEVVGYPKLKDTVDYSQFRIIKSHDYPQEWITYLKRDLEILKEVFIKIGEEDTNVYNKISIGGLAYSNISSIIKTEVGSLTPKEYDYYNNYYYGGACIPNYEFMGKWVYKPDKIKMIDATSMYPSQMILPLPYGKPTKEKPKELSCCYIEVEISRFIIKEKYKDMTIFRKNVKTENKTIELLDLSSGKPQLFLNEYIPYYYFQKPLKYYFIESEFEFLKQIYDIKYKIVKRQYFKLKNYLQEVVSNMFIEKQEASRQNNTTIKLLAKLKLNNLYGKLGQHYDRPLTFYGSLDKIDLNEYIIPTRMKTENNRINKAECYTLHRKFDENLECKPIHVAAYITSQARLSLFNQIKHIIDNRGTYLYCDTDSVVYVDKTKNIEFSNLGDDLGCWEIEKFKKADGFKCLCPKNYRIVKRNLDEPVKQACAGINIELMRKVKNIDFNYQLSQNKKYNLYKKALKIGQFGNVIVESPFDFRKYKHLKNDVTPQELENE